MHNDAKVGTYIFSFIGCQSCGPLRFLQPFPTPGPSRLRYAPGSLARTLFRFLRAAAFLAAFAGILARADAPARARLVRAILSEDVTEQVTLVRELTGTDDPLVVQGLAAWRSGSLFLYPGPDGAAGQPFLSDGSVDPAGKAGATRIADGEPVRDATGTAVRFSAGELTAADTSSKLRKAIKVVLDLRAVEDPEARVRRDAVVKLGQEQESEYLPHFEQRLSVETVPGIRRVLMEAIALTQLSEADPKVRLGAVRRLVEIRSISSLEPLRQLSRKLQGGNEGDLLRAIQAAVKEIEEYQARANLYGTAFRGLSLAAVLLVAALGLAITFGLMGVINMAHGEIIMIGAYTAYGVQNIFRDAFGATGTGFETYFLVALPASFATAGLVGLLLEQGIIRFLYRRPLESMLATWGVSLVLQQVFRHVFGAANVQVNSPHWLSGSFEVSDVLLAYNRLFVIGFAVFIVVLTWLLMTRTSLGLQIRAVMQNRAMASAVGVRTERVNMMTFAFGSGLAGMAGACLSQIGNVGPGLGQNYVVDCFMIVVLGGVGSLPGTVSASLGVGVTDQILQPWLGAVMGKITVLAAIILFLQWRPAGIFASRGRGLEG